MLDSEDDESNDQLRVAVARGLKSYSDAALLDGLVDRSPILRTAAARELHLRGGLRVFDRVKELARASRYEFREVAAFVLGQLEHPTCPYAAESFPMLDILLDDPYWEVRMQALVALASLAMLGHRLPPGILQRFADRAHDDQSEVRATVANTISLVDRVLAGQVLTIMLRDVDAGVRVLAEDELFELNKD
jgi:HEAT repeat protein